MVSDFQQAVSSVGPANDAQAEAKALRELNRDVEATLCSTNDRSAENGAGTPYALRGLGDWIDSAGPSDVPSEYRTPSASIHASGTFTETVLNNLITSIYREVGSNQNMTLVADTALRRVITGFARTEGTTTAKSYFITQSADAKKITFSVSVYDSDYGVVSVVNMNPDCAPDTTNKDYGYLINPQYLGFAELIPLGSTKLEDQGGGERGYVDMTGTLLVKHPQAFGKISVIT
jgi:hypothetical protein